MFRKSSDGTHYRQSFFARNFRTSRKAAERMKHGRIERPRKAALLRRDGLIHSPVPRCDGAGRRGLLDAAAEKYDGQGRGERLLTGRTPRTGRNAADAGGGAAAGGGKAGRTPISAARRASARGSMSPRARSSARWAAARSQSSRCRRICIFRSAKMGYPATQQNF